MTLQSIYEFFREIRDFLQFRKARRREGHKIQFARGFFLVNSGL